MTRPRPSSAIVAALALVLSVAACGDDDATTMPASTTVPPLPGSTAATAVSSTTTNPPTTTTTTTTTTTLPPPVVEWGEPQQLAAIADPAFAGVGQVTDVDAGVIVDAGGDAVVLATTRFVGFIHHVGAFDSADTYQDVAAWTSLDGSEWAEAAAPRSPGTADDVVAAAVPFGDAVVAVGSTRRSGSTPTQVGGAWTFPTDDTDAAVWMRTGAVWEAVDHPALAGDVEEEIIDVAVLGGRLVAVGAADRLPAFGVMELPVHDGAVWISDDGHEWARVEDPEGTFSGQWLDVSFDAAVTDGTTVFVLGVESGSRDRLAVWSSPDGTEWSRIEVTGTTSADSYLYVADAAMSDLGFVAVGNSWGSGEREAVIFSSPDGVTWDRVGVLGDPILGELRSVVAMESGFVAAGVESGSAVPLVLLSGDGVHWYRDTSPALTVEGAERAGGAALGTHAGRLILTGGASYGYESGEFVWSGG